MEWISCKKKLPRNGQYVLAIIRMNIHKEDDGYDEEDLISRYSFVYAQFREMRHGKGIFYSNGRDYRVNGEFFSVTHWAEIPKPKHLQNVPFVGDIIEKNYK